MGKPSDRNETDSQPPEIPRAKLPLAIVVIIVVLLAWGVLLAIGAIRGQQVFDWRKPTIIVGVVGGFVLTWIALLASRNAAQNK